MRERKGGHGVLDTEPLWTVEEVAKYLRLSPTTVRAMARRGYLPARKVGRVWRFLPSAVKTWIQQRREDPLAVILSRDETAGG